MSVYYGMCFQLNQLTHWLDNSQIYGSDEKETLPLRSTIKKGRLLIRSEQTQDGSDNALPSCEYFYHEKPESCRPSCLTQNQGKCTAAGMGTIYFI